jgi:hypothetical protein
VRSLEQAASYAPTFIGGNLIVSEIEVQVARDPELNLGNHSEYTYMYVYDYGCVVQLCTY